MNRLIQNGIRMCLVWSCALVLSGCHHYQLGMPNKLPFKTVYVAPVKNSSFAPQAQAVLAQQVVDALMREGVKVTDAHSADVTLSIELVEYTRTASATQPEDTLLAQSFAAETKANATLIDNRSGQVYFADRLHASSQQVFVDEGFQSSEYQAMPVILRRLAVNIVSTIVSTW